MRLASQGLDGLTMADQQISVASFGEYSSHL
jgi:hypothetical protein